MMLVTVLGLTAAVAAVGPLPAAVPATCMADTTHADLAKAGGPLAAVLAIDGAYEKSILTGDPVTLAATLHPAFYYVHAGKSKQDDKASWVATVAKGSNYTCRSFAIDKVMAAGNTIILSGTLDVRYDHAKAPNAPPYMTGMLQRTYARDGGHWQLLAQTVGYIQPEGVGEGKILAFLDSLK
jgi:hypothetical protein